MNLTDQQIELVLVVELVIIAILTALALVAGIGEIIAEIIRRRNRR
jgi:hypothetical protein